jgi:hypothetical protein
MNLLAYVVHHLMTGADKEHLAPQLAELSRLEQTILTELQPLLRRAPQDLALILAQIDQGRDWDRLLPL